MQYYNGKPIVQVGKYPAVYMPKHPQSNDSGMVYVHILQAELILSRHLRNGEVVHHIDKNKLNFNLDNLMIFASESDHSRYHRALDENKDFVLISTSNVYRCVVGTGLIRQCLSAHGLQEHIPAQKRAICPQCGSWMSTNATVCVACYKHDKRIKSARPDKSELIRQLHMHKNFVQVGKNYGVSDAAVRKWCRYYGLPDKTRTWKESV